MILFCQIFLKLKKKLLLLITEALKSSTIKIAGRDVLATWKLLVALVVTPILYGFYTFITLLLVYKYDLKRLQFGWWTPIIVYLMFYLVSNFTMHLADSGFDVYRLATLFLHIYSYIFIVRKKKKTFLIKKK